MLLEAAKPATAPLKPDSAKSVVQVAGSVQRFSCTMTLLFGQPSAA
jgi:hypothetical protein